jgi:photosystem II stability/assembly factor-like uncharacterized protein
MKLTVVVCWIVQLFFPLMVKSQQDAEWRWVAPYPPRVHPYSSTVIGNRAYFWSEENLVMTASEGGSVFSVSQYAPTEDVALGCCNGHGIAFADTLTGYVMDIAYGQFRTTDGGKSWSQIGDPYSGFEMVEFGSSSTGWKLGEGGTYRTVDGGYSWSPVGQLYSIEGIFSSIFALDEERVWVMKSYYFGSLPGGSIWYSENGGVSWTEVNTILSSDTTAQVTYSSMRINPSGVGFAVGSIYRPSTELREGFILKTTDFGTNWTYTSYPDERWEDIVSINDSVWVLFGNAGSYPTNQPIDRRTTDMGSTWTLTMRFTTVNYQYLYAGVYLEPSNTIIVVTVQGIYSSTDQGETYSRLTSDRDIIVTDVVVEEEPASPSEQAVIAKATYSPVYLLSTDGGTQWLRREIPSWVGSEIWGTRVVDGQIFMITNQTQLYRSTDLGVNWSRINVPAYGALRALDVYDANTIALQGYPNLLSSSDGGVTWVNGPFPGTMFLHESSIVRPGEIIAVGGFYDSTGTKGVLYHTTDNGLNWRIEDAPAEVKMISMTDENVGFAMGASHLYKTTNSGRAWSTSYSTTGYYSLSAFCFENLAHGVLRDSYSDFETNDGGVTWQESAMSIPVQYPVHRMAYSARGELLVAGNGRLVIRSAGEVSMDDIPNNGPLRPLNLSNSFPNPFNPTTTIRFSLPTSGDASLTIFNLLGEEVAVLVSGHQEAGSHLVQWDARDMPSGVYFYRLQAGDYVETKKLVLLR